MSLRRRLAAVLTAVTLALATASAGAHAFLDRAEPRVGSAVRTPPAEVKLWFTQKLEPAFSTLQVTDAGGNRVDTHDGRVDAADGALLRTGLLPLGSGRYTVTWRVLSVDTHVTSGDFTFTVKR
ncbi:MAG: copper resistance protein CopC [Candidatus Rokubacteria bacterium]|nr:copper resistance protein CopC [Candidatus Rokubacteria bacterium]MBI3826025.1 copper resistance protein CopC [Candidatus Rokubacteria bacterium]